LKREEVLSITGTQRFTIGFLSFIAIVVPIIWNGAAVAQERKIVSPGGTVDLAKSDNPITIGSGTLKGLLKVNESPSSPKYVLVYTAPAGTSEFSDTIKYSADGSEHTVLVSSGSSSDAVYGESFKVLFFLFVLAILVEQGLAVIFNWRPFLLLFDAKGVRTIIAVGFAWIFVDHFDLDITSKLANIYYPGSNYSISPLGKFITALILAGGSSGVNNLLVALGFRSVKTAEQVTPKPARTEGWVAVTLRRQNAVGPVTALIGNPANGGPPAAGTITGTAPRAAFVRYFLRDPARFPPSGGFSVPAGERCQITLAGVDNQGQARTAAWGPYPISAGAIIDVDLRV
jgi:hypothetical protein